MHTHALMKCMRAYIRSYMHLYINGSAQSYCTASEGALRTLHGRAACSAHFAQAPEEPITLPLRICTSWDRLFLDVITQFSLQVKELV